MRNLLLLFFTFSIVTIHAQWQMQIQNNIYSLEPRIKMINSQKGYFSDRDYIYITNNGGQNWNKIDSALGFSVLSDMQVINDSTVITLFTGNSNSSYIRLSTNSGLTWQSSSVITNNVLLNSVEFSTATNGVVCGNSGKIYRTINSGLTWSQIIPPTNANFEEMKFVSATTGYIIGSSSVILKTTNGGASWNSLNFPLTNQQHYQIDFLNQDTGIVVGTAGISRTFNGGSSWATVFSGPSVWSIEYVSTDTLYAAGSDKFIMRSNNGGTSWDTLNYIAGQNPFQTDFLNNNLGWCATAGAGLYKTNSGGFSCPSVNFASNSPDTICGINPTTFGLFTDFHLNICPVTITPSANAYVNSTSVNGNYMNISGGSNQNFDNVYFIANQNNTAIGCPNGVDTIFVYADSNAFAPTFNIPTGIDSACVGDTLHMGPGAYDYLWLGQNMTDTLSTSEYVVVSQSMLGTLLHPQAKLCNGWNNYYLFLNQYQNCLTTENLNQVSDEIGWNIFPNPACDEITIKFSSTTDMKISMKDLSGRILGKYTFEKDCTKINCSEIPNGIYFIVLQKENKIIYNKIIVSH
ncbi:MAG: YCF48-related protein [Bacteroidota bacterium]|jgi:photosystem II stability/assembly factor-like uncharacterized protein